MQCLQVTVVRGISSDQTQRIILRAGSILRIGRDAASDVQVDFNGVSGVHAELSLQAVVAGSDTDQALELCICDRSKNGTAIRAGPRVLGSGWTGKVCPAFERLKPGATRSLPHGWQMLVPAKSRKGDQQIPIVQRLLTVFTEPVEEPAPVLQAAPEEAAAPAATLPAPEEPPEAVAAAEPIPAQEPIAEMAAATEPAVADVGVAEEQLRAAQSGELGAEGPPLSQEEKERRRRERKEKRKAEKRAAAGTLQAPQPVATIAPAAPPVAAEAQAAVAGQKRERKKRLRAEEGQVAPAPIPLSALGAAGTPPPVPEDRRVAQAGAVEEEMARQEAERAKAVTASAPDVVTEEVARTARPKRRARAPAQPTATPGAGDEDSEQTDVPEDLELSDPEAAAAAPAAALRKAGTLNGLPAEEPGMPAPVDAAAGASSATTAVSEAALAEEKVRAAAAAAAMRKAAARAAAKENAAAVAAAAAEPPKARKAKEPRTKVRQRPDASPEPISDGEERAQVSAPLTAAAVATLPSDVPLFELRSVSPISAPGITPKKRRRKNAGPGESASPGRRTRKREARREVGKQLRGAAAEGSGRRRATLNRGQWQDGADSDDAAAPEPEHLPDRWAPSPSPALPPGGVAASSSKRATAANISSRVPAIPPSSAKGRSRSRGKATKRRARSDDEKPTEKLRARSRDRRRQQREIAAAAALAGEPVRRTRR